MAFVSFTVTQITYNFTATVTTPVQLNLGTTGTNLLVTATTATILVNNTIQPVTVSGVQQFNQELNTFDNVSFASVTTPVIYGFAGAPVNFPTGITAGYFNSIDFVAPGDP